MSAFILVLSLNLYQTHRPRPRPRNHWGDDDDDDEPTPEIKCEECLKILGTIGVTKGDFQSKKIKILIKLT